MEEINLKELILVVWRKKFVIIGVTVLFAIAGFLKVGFLDNKIQMSNSLDEKKYYAKTNFIVGTSENIISTKEDTNPILSLSGRTKIKMDDNLLSTYKELVKVRSSIENVIKNLELDVDVKTLSNSIILTQKGESNVLTIGVAYQEEDKVTKIANEVLKEFSNTIKRVYVVDNLTVLDEAFLVSESEILENSDFSILVATSPNSNIRHIFKYMVEFAFVGCALAVFAVILIDSLDSSVKNEDFLEREEEVKILSKIDKTGDENDGMFAVLVSNFVDSKTFLITSAETKDGKTYVANKLANELVKFKKKVLLIDLSSNQSDLISHYDGKGLNDYIMNNNQNIFQYILDTKEDNLKVLLAGNMSKEYLDETKAKELLKELEKKYDAIIIDSKNILEDVNTLTFAKICQNTILVVKTRKTNSVKFIKAKNVIADVKGNLIGCVLIK